MSEVAEEVVVSPIRAAMRRALQRNRADGRVNGIKKGEKWLKAELAAGPLSLDAVFELELPFEITLIDVCDAIEAGNVCSVVGEMVHLKQSAVE